MPPKFKRVVHDMNPNSCARWMFFILYIHLPYLQIKYYYMDLYFKEKKIYFIDEHGIHEVDHL